MGNNRELFSSFSSINRESGQRKFVFFGAGNIAAKTFRKINKTELLSIVDNSLNLWGDEQLGVRVISPDELAAITPRPYVVITTTSFSDVATQLDQLGFEAGKDYQVSPILNDLIVIDNIERLEKRLIFTSGAPEVDDEGSGGGIYELNVNGQEWEHKKRVGGTYHGLTICDQRYVAVDSSRGIIQFDEGFSEISVHELPLASRAHGISICAETKHCFVACSYLDAVIRFDENFKEVTRYNVSKKALRRDGGPYSHCNDCLVSGKSLFVSMFSYTGNWKLDVFDGVILEIDLDTGEHLGTVIDDLWMPHNVQLVDGSLACLDSLRGDLRFNNMMVQGSFPAFTRGLYYDNNYFFIGQSKNRNFSKTIGLSNNISVDTGIIVFDNATKVSRFIQLPPKLSEIHAISESLS